LRGLGLRREGMQVVDGIGASEVHSKRHRQTGRGACEKKRAVPMRLVRLRSGSGIHEVCRLGIRSMFRLSRGDESRPGPGAFPPRRRLRETERFWRINGCDPAISLPNVNGFRNRDHFTRIILDRPCNLLQFCSAILGEAVG
ncbi:MAG: hypothetical protein ACR2GP_11595, partial [Burkholderiaceae bacterium]